MVWERLTAPDRYFYPRPPRGERRCGLAKSALPRVISIHALREESDPSSYFALYLVLYFYPRPPRGERLHLPVPCCHFVLFLSTPSARRATPDRGHPAGGSQFLSTPSARRATFVPSRLLWEHWEFLSTPSARRATNPN